MLLRGRELPGRLHHQHELQQIGADPVRVRRAEPVPVRPDQLPAVPVRGCFRLAAAYLLLNVRADEGRVCFEVQAGPKVPRGIQRGQARKEAQHAGETEGAAFGNFKAFCCVANLVVHCVGFVLVRNSATAFTPL